MLCSATALAIGLHLNSWHSHENQKYNNVNPGVYVAYEGYIAGTYKNSLNKQTLYAGRVFDLTENCRYDVVIGAATGYNIDGMKVTPFVVASAKFEVQDDTILRVSTIPQVSSEGSVKGVVLHFSVQKNF
jgi:hypothetical protein